QGDTSSNLEEEPGCHVCRETNMLIDKVYNSSSKLGEVSLCDGGVCPDMPKTQTYKKSKELSEYTKNTHIKFRDSA
ncbi:MAG: hypothetical protein NC206_02125, partial [Bacteroides sp.]|nr:hypothetical protein [Bacteroides sp.]